MTDPAAPIRAFVALELPAPVRDALAITAEAARPSAPGKLAWVRPEGVHLTLAFLGASEPERLRALEARLRAACAGRAPFELALGEPGVFPGARRPAVLWVGVQPSDPLAALQAEVAAEARALGWTLDARPFSPHLTSARVKWPGPPGALADAWLKVAPPAARWSVEAVSLMRSDPDPAGARYTALATLPLGGDVRTL